MGAVPFIVRAQSVSIAVSRVMVTQNVEVGRNYLLESSMDMVTWVEAAPPFTAEAERIETEFSVNVTGRFFRLRDLDEEKIDNLPDAPVTLSDLGLKLMPIPAGTFTMGSYDEVDFFKHEGPFTTVTISRSFWLGETELTQGQWEAVMGNNPSGFKGNNQFPVENVTWSLAMDICEKLNEFYGETLPIGYRYTLPTEAQWEYACRAGTSTRFYYGDDPDYSQLNQYAWYRDNSGNRTHPVGEKLPNAWGLYDMHGNVKERCSDWYRSSYQGGSVRDPQGGLPQVERSVRGGSWNTNGWACRSAARDRWGPGQRTDFLGFRVALSSSPMP